MDEKEQTRRDLLSAAWDEVEEKDDDIAVVEDDSAQGVPGDKSGSAGEDERGLDGSESSVEEVDEAPKAKKTEKESKKPATDETQRKEAEAAAKPDGKGEPAKPEPVTDKAPQSWKPAAREAWSKIPAEARAEIKRLDIEVQRTMSQNANVRKFANDFAQIVNPYSHIIRAQNSTPLDAVRNLMGTAAALAQGSAGQKAAIIAEICQNYKVDLKVLDDYLAENWDINSGSLKGRQPQHVEAPPAWAQPILAKQQQFDQIIQQQEQALRANADKEIEKVESLPYFNDLKDDIADLMEVAANRGKIVTLQQAYNLAVDMDPEISKIVKQRKLAEKAGEQRKVISRARRAASSISGGPSGKAAGNGSGEKQSRREILSAQWDEMS